MKKTCLTVIGTALLTWILFCFIQAAHSGVERLWLVSAVKVPGNKAIADIQENLKDGRNALAAAKLEAFKQTWDQFNKEPDSFNGRGIGDIMVTFSKLDADYATNSLAHQ